jgi:hypothetical protein
VLPIVGSAPAQSTVTWTSATALNTALTYTGLAPYGAVTIGITVPTTVTAGAVTVETSLDGTNWTQAGSVRVDNSLVENVVSLAYWPGTNGTRQYLVSLDALAQVRVRLSTVITGTGNVTVIIAPAQQGVEPFVATRARKIATYTALFKAAARPYLLSNVFTANTRKQYATIHHAATATRTVDPRGVGRGSREHRRIRHQRGARADHDRPGDGEPARSRRPRTTRRSPRRKRHAWGCRRRRARKARCSTTSTTSSVRRPPRPSVPHRR